MTSIVSKSNFSSKRKNPGDIEYIHSGFSSLSEKKTKTFKEEEEEEDDDLDFWDLDFLDQYSEDQDPEYANMRLTPDLKNLVFGFTGTSPDFVRITFGDGQRGDIKIPFDKFVAANYGENYFLLQYIVSKLSSKEISACVEYAVREENFDMIKFFLNMGVCFVEQVRLLSCRTPEKTDVFFYFFDRFDRKNKKYLEEAIHYGSFEIAAFLIRTQACTYSAEFVVRELVEFGEDEENILDLLNFDEMPYHMHLQYINESVDNDAFDVFVKLLKAAPKCVATSVNINPSSEPSFRQHLEKLYIRG